MKRANVTRKASDRKQANAQKARVSRVTTHERQAKTAASAFARGEFELNRLLTSADAAAPIYGAHEGYRLPFGLLAMLEGQYHADLDAVRIHADEQAAELADQAGAQAFTSGRDIFFNAGAYQPNTGEGQRLIAHEVAHVLQQTARADAEGVWHAAAVYGSGGVQCEEFTWARVKSGYQTETKGSDQAALDDLGKITTEIEAVVGAETALTAKLGKEKAVIDFEKRVTKGEFNQLSPVARSLLMDTLKVLERFDGAAYLLTKDPFLKTAIPSEDFRKYFIDSAKYGKNWVTGIFASIPAVKKVFPAAYLDGLWEYLTQPASQPSASKALNDAIKAMQKYIDEWDAGIGSVFFTTTNACIWHMSWRVICFKG